MRNRAKCLKCKQIIESVAPNDVAACFCTNLMIAGGDESPRINAKDWNKFAIVEDDGREVSAYATGSHTMVWRGDEEKGEAEQTAALTRCEKLDMLETKIAALTSTHPPDMQDVIDALTIIHDLSS